MRVRDLYTMCDNLSPEVLFNFYEDYLTYKKQNTTNCIMRVNFDTMPNHLYNAVVKMFWVYDDGDEIDVLI